MPCSVRAPGPGFYSADWAMPSGPVPVNTLRGEARVMIEPLGPCRGS
jgi:hypothetical protein